MYIVGEGEEKNNLQEVIKAQKCKSRVFIKPVSTNVLSFINGCKAFIFSSLSESCPNVILEALILNKPIVALDDHAGVRELLKYAKTGILVSQKSEAIFADAIIQGINLKKINPTKRFYKRYVLQSISEKFYHTLQKSLF